MTRLGPLHLVTFERGQGFVTYRDLDGLAADDTYELVAGALEHFRADSKIERVGWRTCSHDRTPALVPVLIQEGFTVGPTESIMVGETRALAVATDLSMGITLRSITERADVSAMEEMQGEVFDDPTWPLRVDIMMRRLAQRDGMQMWIAEADGVVITAGRIEPIPGTDFAELCGGATRIQWRGHGIYRALTAARADAALQLGKTLLHSCSTEYSRPILQRAGLVKVGETTMYHWRSAR